MTNVCTSDGRVFPVTPEFVQECTTLKQVMEMTDSCDHPMETIPLPNVDAAIMETVIRFFEAKSLPEFTQPQDYFPLMFAGDYLGYETLLDECAKEVAELLKGRDPKYVRDVFGLDP